MKLLNMGFKRITDDLKQKKLMPLKILFFVHASTILVLYPYLTIHMRELGINVEETAIMSAVTPIVFFIMPPLAGLLADKIGNFKLLLALSSSLGGAAALLLLVVPAGRLTITYPTSIELLVRCDSERLLLHNIQDQPCMNINEHAQLTNFTLLSCGFVCDLPNDISADEVDSLLQMRFYDIHIRTDKDDVQPLLYRHSVTVPAATVASDKDTSARVLTNNPFFDQTVLKVAERRLFFPAPNLYNFECSIENDTCYFRKMYTSTLENINVSISTERFPLETHSLTLSVETGNFTYYPIDNTTVDGRSYWVKLVSIVNEKGVALKQFQEDHVSCRDNFAEDSDIIHVRAGSRMLTRCTVACASKALRRQLCNVQRQQIDIDPTFTFWIYLAVRMFIGVISGMAFAMFEGAVIAVIREQRADYGLQRAYGSLGGMISSPLSGMLIDYASRGKDYTDFRPAFYLYAVLKVVTGGLILSIDLEFKQPAQNLLQDVITVFKNIEMVALFIACFVMGTAWGYIESFLFWLLKDMNASSSLMGFTVTVGGVAGLPLLVYSGPIIQRLGHANVIFMGFVFYAIRLLGYSLIYDPWLCLIFEAMESVTSSLAFTAAVTYAARLSSTTTDTSVQGLLGGVYYGVGKGAGSLIGGYLMKAFGTRPTYQIFAVATLVTGCMYFLFNKFYLHKRITNTGNDITEKKPPTLDLECKGSMEKEKKNTDGVVKKLELKTMDDVCTDSKIDAENADKNSFKLVSDNIDGGSDSGVENPVYSETETPPSGDDKKETLKRL